MLILFAVVLLLHGVAHLVGFVGAWQLSDRVPHDTTLLGGAIELGEAGTRAVGVVWLLAALAFAIGAVGALRRASWWPALVVIAALGSLAMCLLALPEAQAGAALDLALIGAVLLGMRLGWFHRVAG
jgi:hypothetical protein